MKTYRKMYAAYYTGETFFIDKFEIGANAYREDEDGSIEKLRVVSVLFFKNVITALNKIDEAMGTYGCDYDYDVVFNHNNVTYAIAFESDGLVNDELEIDDIIYC